MTIYSSLSYIAFVLVNILALNGITRTKFYVYLIFLAVIFGYFYFFFANPAHNIQDFDMSEFCAGFLLMLASYLVMLRRNIQPSDILSLPEQVKIGSESLEDFNKQQRRFLLAIVLLPMILFLALMLYFGATAEQYFLIFFFLPIGYYIVMEILHFLLFDVFGRIISKT